MATVYILYSETRNRYYIGSCVDFSVRLEEHKTKKYPSAFTANADDWSVFLTIDALKYTQARNIEAFIKRMKNRKYIESLKEPSRVEWLKERWA